MNPIFQQTQQNQINDLSAMYKNPMAYLSQMANGNPVIAQTVNMLNGGANPEQVFYQLAKQKGVDPNAFLQMVKGSMR